MTKKQQRLLTELVEASRKVAEARAARRRLQASIPKAEEIGYYTREPGKSQIEAVQRASVAALDTLERAARAVAKAMPTGDPFAKP